MDTDVAERLTEAIMQKLEGSMMETFQSMARHVKIALYEALREILSPQASQSIFTDVVDTRDWSVPHTIILLGVNGIIKTNNMVRGVWAGMCVKWGVALGYYGHKYKLLLDREYSLI